MAVAVIEKLSANATSTTISIHTDNFTPNPSIGDLLVAHFAYAATGATITLPSGWTEIIKTENAGSNLTSQISYKIADSGDAGGQDLTWSKGAGSVTLKLAMMRITGNRSTNIITSSSGQATDASTTITATTLTPLEADSLLLFFAFAAAAPTVSGYAIATSNPSWTELYDENGLSHGFSAAWAVRPEVTATGSATATSSDIGDNIGQMIVVSAMPNFTSSDTATVTETVAYSFSLLISEILTATDLTSATSVVVNYIQNVAKNVASWINQDKN